MKKKKSLFIISDDLFVRNYIDTGVYKFLEKIFNICLIANENINSKEKINCQNIADQKLIDNILDKISKSGYESLTKNEKEILFKKSDKN